MNKTVVSIAVLVFIFFVFLFMFLADETFDPTDVANYPTSGNTVVAFGDSLVYGVGSSREGGFVTLLSKELNVPIENLGRGGDTTQHGIDRLEDVLAHEPDVVLLLLGGNDFLDRVPRKEVFGNLETIITRLQEQGAIVLLLGIRGGILGDGYDREFEKLAKEKKVAYVPNVLDGLIGEPEYMDDAIHPNDAGYAVIAGRIAPVLEQLLQ